MMIDLIDKYASLFHSLVFLCFGYGILLVFYANDKIREIDKAHRIKSRQVKEVDQKQINENTRKAKGRLTGHCKIIMLVMLGITLLFNTLSIVIKGYIDIYGFLGGYVFPVSAYFIFVFFLMIAMGLKGATVLRTGQFFKGLDN